MLFFQGGFAKCYKLTDKKSNSIYAGKIVSQNRVSKSREKEKVSYYSMLIQILHKKFETISLRM